MKLKIGKAIVYFREQRGMSQTDLAEATGIRQPTISLYENDRRMPEQDNMSLITSALGITERDLENYVMENKDYQRESVSYKSYREPAIKYIRQHDPEFFITDDISIAIKARVRDHSNRKNYRYNVITDIIEIAITEYIERHYDEIDEIVTEELKGNIKMVESFLDDIRTNRY